MISGAYGLTKAGNGALTLSTNNTFTGTIVNNGILNLSNGGGSGTVRGPLTINAGATVNQTFTDSIGTTLGLCVQPPTLWAAP